VSRGTPSEEERIAEAAARAGGAIVRAAAQDGPRRVSHKAAVDLVTEVDLAAEAAIVALLAARSPGVPVHAEEGGGAEGARTRWVVDPLDGTTNFVHGLPIYAVSVGLQVDGQVVAGCVYDPVRDRAFTASRGRGARCEGAPIAVSTVAGLDGALLATGFPTDRRERAEYYLGFVARALRAGQGIRRGGSAATDLCWVASGCTDGFFELGLHAWDVAAGSLLVEEAGGRVSDLALGPLDLDRPRLLATNGRIHDALSALLAPLLS
jgi:myo-inositol-1(or 4)-monophosphatase